MVLFYEIGEGRKGGYPLILERGGYSYKYGCDSEVSP